MNPLNTKIGTADEIDTENTAWRAADDQEKRMLAETVTLMTHSTHDALLPIYDTPQIMIVEVRAYDEMRDAKWSSVAHAVAKNFIETVFADPTIETAQVFALCIAHAIEGGDVEEKKNAIVTALINLCYEYRGISEANYIRLDGIKTDIIRMLN